MKLPVNVLFRAAEAHLFISGSDPTDLPETQNTTIRRHELLLSSIVHLNSDHTWGKIPVRVNGTHHNSPTIYLVASDLISNGKDVHHPDAGQDGLKYTLFS